MELEDLYREVILDHYRSPRNAENLDRLPHAHVHENPSCGDSIKLDLRISEDGIIEHIVFDGRGCAMSTASGSIMTEMVCGLSVAVAAEKAARFVSTMRAELPIETLDELGDLKCFQGVSHYPLRVKCVTLAWHALLDSLDRITVGRSRSNHSGRTE